MAKNERGWERVEVDTRLHWKTIMEKYGVGRTVAYEAKKRGWVAVPRERGLDICKDPETFDTNSATIAARTIFWREFGVKMKDPHNWIDDCLQEARLRMFEMAGDKDIQENFAYFCKVGRWAMQGYLNRNQVTGVMRGRITDFGPFENAEQRLCA